MSAAEWADDGTVRAYLARPCDECGHRRKSHLDRRRYCVAVDCKCPAYAGAAA